MPEWRVSVGHLMETCRGGLAALTSVVEQARIPWRQGEAYDDWDEIADVLYRRIVLDPLRSAFPDEPDLRIQEYDVLYPQYCDLSLLTISPREQSSGLWIFHRFETQSTAFDSVGAVFLPAGENCTASRRTRFPCSEVNYEFRLRERGGGLQPYRSLRVPL